jgi:hypothetical protein
VEVAPLKKQKMIGDDNGNDISGNDNDDSLSTDDYSSEMEEEVSSEEEEMNLWIGSEQELLIQRGRSNDWDTSNDEEESHFFSDDD